MTFKEKFEARQREQEAWDQRYKHAKAARAWREIAEESPERREVSKILATWMSKYEVADAEAEQAFRALAGKAGESGAM